MRTMCAAIVACWAMAWPAKSVRAQMGSADSIKIQVAVATFARDSLSLREAKFESRVTRGRTVLPERDATRNAAIGRALNATPAHQEEVLECGRQATIKCTLKVDDFVTIQEPVINGRSATVVVSHMKRSGMERIPITSIEYLLTLRQLGSDWVVSSKKMLSIS